MSEKLAVSFSGALGIWGRRIGLKSGVSTGYYVMIQPERRLIDDGCCAAHYQSGLKACLSFQHSPVIRSGVSVQRHMWINSDSSMSSEDDELRLVGEPDPCQVPELRTQTSTNLRADLSMKLFTWNCILLIQVSERVVYQISVDAMSRTRIVAVLLH